MTLSDEEIDAIAERVLSKLTEALRMNRAGALTKFRAAIEQPVDAVSKTYLRHPDRNVGEISIKP